MKAGCFKILDARPQTNSATLVIAFGVPKRTADSYRSYHRWLCKGGDLQKEVHTATLAH